MVLFFSAKFPILIQGPFTEVAFGGSSSRYMNCLCLNAQTQIRLNEVQLPIMTIEATSHGTSTPTSHLSLLTDEKLTHRS